MEQLKETAVTDPFGEVQRLLTTRFRQSIERAHDVLETPQVEVFGHQYDLRDALITNQIT